MKEIYRRKKFSSLVVKALGNINYVREGGEMINARFS